jgi:hypothetical protein
MHFEPSDPKIEYMTFSTVPVEGLLLAVFRNGSKARSLDPNLRLIPTLLSNMALSTVLLKHKEVFGSFLDLTLRAQSSDPKERQPCIILA